MVLELYVWGPAFSLPSLDVSSLAAIAYLALAVPRDEWALVPSCDAEQSPIKQLPALRDGTKVVGGYENIIAYLSSKNQQWDLDGAYQNPRDKADIIAFTSHILSTGPPLLALSLYVSSENYSSTTRPAYSRILPWPTQYLLPPNHRTAAKTLTAHLGLDALDLDTPDEEERLRRKNASLIPQGLRSGLGGKPTVTGLVKQQQTTARFRLDALVDAFCAPLQQLLGRKRYLISDEKPSSLDALTLAYFSLALVPDVPQKWLADGLRDRYPALCAYVEKGIEDIYGGGVQPEDVFATAAAQMTREESGAGDAETSALPWQKPEPQTLHSRSSYFLSHALDIALPFSASKIIPPRSSSASSDTDLNLSHRTTTTSSSSSTPFLLPALTTAAATVLAAVGAYIIYPAFMNVAPTGRGNRSLNDMGEAGSFFEGMDFRGGGGDGGGYENGRIREDNSRGREYVFR